jgi:transcriptional regulator with XRE-family HTH domain
MTVSSHTASLLAIYGRNIDVAAFKRGWSTAQLSTLLGISTTALNRIRSGRNRSIDPELLQRFTELFHCDFNALLTPQTGIDYKTDA